MVPQTQMPTTPLSGARPPRLLRQVQPEYPPAARRDHIHGVVLLEVRIDREGRILEPVRVLKSIPALDAAAISALRSWRFLPARDEHGGPIAAVLEVPLRFVLR